MRACVCRQGNERTADRIAMIRTAQIRKPNEAEIYEMKLDAETATDVAAATASDDADAGATTSLYWRDELQLIAWKRSVNGMRPQSHPEKRRNEQAMS